MEIRSFEAGDIVWYEGPTLQYHGLDFVVVSQYGNAVNLKCETIRLNHIVLASENLRLRRKTYKPDYYNSGGFQVFDAIEKLQLDFLQGNVLKYITRYRKKNGVEDLQKARAYIDRMIEEASRRDSSNPNEEDQSYQTH